MPTRSAKCAPSGRPVVHLGHGGLHAEPGAHGALGVVLVRHRRAEDRHHVVADVLVDRAAVALHLVAEAQQRAVHERLHRLGSMPLGERGVAGQVGEQHRHLAALLGRDRGSAGGRRPRARRGPARRVERRAAGHAEAGLGRARACRSSGSAARARVPQFMQKRAPAGFSVPQDGAGPCVSEVRAPARRRGRRRRDLRKQALVHERELAAVHLDQRARVGRVPERAQLALEVVARAARGAAPRTPRASRSGPRPAASRGSSSPPERAPHHALEQREQALLALQVERERGGGVRVDREALDLDQVAGVEAPRRRSGRTRPTRSCPRASRRCSRRGRACRAAAPGGS